MNNKKRILAIAAVICVLSGSMAYAEYDPDKVIDPTNPIMTLSADGEAEDAPSVMNGATLPSVSVKEVNGVKMIPLRSVAEGLGYTVTWKGEMQIHRRVEGRTVHNNVHRQRRICILPPCSSAPGRSTHSGWRFNLCSAELC